MSPLVIESILSFLNTGKTWFRKILSYSSKVDSLTFLEIKSGNARLNKPQRLIRDAIKDERVSYEEV